MTIELLDAGFVFPAASLNVPLGTLTEPLAKLPDVGVKIAL
jgi:hypothetical protein